MLVNSKESEDALVSRDACSSDSCKSHKPGHEVSSDSDVRVGGEWSEVGGEWAERIDTRVDRTGDCHFPTQGPPSRHGSPRFC